MAILPQSPTVPGGLSVYDLVSYGRTPYQSGFARLSKHDREMVDWALKVTGLSKLQQREVDTLSGGQRQRIGIARALYKEAEIILLDEATSALDNHTEMEINTMLAGLRKVYTGLTILSIAHRESSLSYCDRIITID